MQVSIEKSLYKPTSIKNLPLTHKSHKLNFHYKLSKLLSYKHHFSKCLSVSVSLCLFVCLFVWLLPYSGHYICKVSLLFLSVMILWHNLYFRQLSPIIFYFIFSAVYWVRIHKIEFARLGLPLPVRWVGKPFKVSTNYFVLFVSVCFLSCP